MPNSRPPSEVESLAGLSLLVPDQPEWLGSPVAEAWRRQGGRLRPVARYWRPSVRPSAALRLYGPDIFCRTLAARLGLELLAPRDEVLVSLPRCLLRRCVRLGTLGTLRGRRPQFVKPVEPKLFRAQIIDGPAPILRGYSATRRATPVLAADVVAFEAEVRVFVLDGQVATAALYRGQAEPADALPLVRALLACVPLPRAAVVDVGRLASGAWAVVEFNATYAAAAYGCEPAAVARCLAAATRPTVTRRSMCPGRRS